MTLWDKLDQYASIAHVYKIRAMLMFCQQKDEHCSFNFVGHSFVSYT